ncbi:hypothetical protein TEA_010846 [Camellia sinensis var. sinensis]|uniref:DUF4408 domain-containing protein n=1 Tax=Camellia sinensis var. sinensis TaxID=542762 RepID=A0A4S4EQX4_CAMSN|nr:hypothetical protein TEA_010846 [Camellia sinensis var. sinensis]
MDAIKIAKIQAINKFKRKQLLNNLFLYSLTALITSFFCSSSFFCYPPLFSCMKAFLSVSLPQISSPFFNSKLSFIVCNLIIVFLVGESKVFTSDSPSASNIYYDVCFNRRRSPCNLSSIEKVVKFKRRYNHKGGNKITSCVYYPLQFSCMKTFLFVSLPQISSLLFISQCFFLVCNLIVIFLHLPESKSFTSYSSSTSDVYYDVYVNRRSLHNLSSLDKKEEAKLERRYNCKGGNRITRDITQEFVKNTIEYRLGGEISPPPDPKSFEEKVVSAFGEERRRMEKQDEELDREGYGLPVEELNKRADDFIARVNKRRRIEAALLSAQDYT